MHAAQYKGGMIMLKRSLHLLGVVALAILLSGIVGVGQASASSPIKEEKGAKVSVVIVAKSAGADTSTLVYDITAANHRETFARNVIVSVPFKGAALQLADVQFSGGPAWIETQGPNTLVYRIDGLHINHPTTATVRFTKLPNAPKDIGLTDRVSFAWTVEGRNDSGTSNVPMPLKPYYSLDVSQLSTPEGTAQRFAGSIFAPDEPVTFWCNMPDGEIHALMIRSGPNAVLAHRVTAQEKRAHSFVEAIRTDSKGAMSIDFPLKDLDSGYYSIVAYGQWSGLQAVGTFQMK
jgi:hypothetical protein